MVQASTITIGAGSEKGVKSDVQMDLVRAPKGVPETVVAAKPGAIPKGGGSKFLITSVEDGDTVYGKDKATGNPRTCRLETIDAPETSHPKHGLPGQPYGDESKRKLQDLVSKGEVTIKVVKEDSYGRSICQISVEGANVEPKMLEAGMAWLSRTYHKSPELIAIEDKAIESGIGLWADKVRESPGAYKARYRGK